MIQSPEIKEIVPVVNKNTLTEDQDKYAIQYFIMLIFQINNMFKHFYRI